MRYITLCILIVSLASCGKDNNPSPVPTPISLWEIAYSVGMPATMIRQPNGFYVFNFPQAPGSVHYVFEDTGPLVAGKTISLVATIAGTGTLIPTGTGDVPPATLHLFMQRKGDDLCDNSVNNTCPTGTEFHRLWSSWTVLKVGTFTVSQKLNPTLWTGVFGRQPSVAQFNAMLSNIEHIGFTFGGAYFAGHGVRAQGSMTFALQSYVVK